MRVHQCREGIVADGADVAEVVQPSRSSSASSARRARLGQARRDPERLRPHAKTRRRRPRCCRRRCGRRVEAAREAGASHQPVDALVDVSKPLFQPDHGLAAGGKAKCPGSMPARRSDRNLVQAVAFRWRGNGTASPSAMRRCDPQWKAHAPAVVVEPGAGIGRTLGG